MVLVHQKTSMMDGCELWAAVRPVLEVPSLRARCS